MRTRRRWPFTRQGQRPWRTSLRHLPWDLRLQARGRVCARCSSRLSVLTDTPDMRVLLLATASPAPAPGACAASCAPWFLGPSLPRWTPGCRAEGRRRGRAGRFRCWEGVKDPDAWLSQVVDFVRCTNTRRLPGSYRILEDVLLSLKTNTQTKPVKNIDGLQKIKKKTKSNPSSKVVFPLNTLCTPCGQGVCVSLLPVWTGRLGPPWRSGQPATLLGPQGRGHSPFSPLGSRASQLKQGGPWEGRVGGTQARRFTALLSLCTSTPVSLDLLCPRRLCPTCLVIWSLSPSPGGLWVDAHTPLGGTALHPGLLQPPGPDPSPQVSSGGGDLSDH